MIFSQRYGYSTVDDTFIRESIPESIQNSICNCYDELSDNLTRHGVGHLYVEMEKYLWHYFFNNRVVDFYYLDGRAHEDVLIPFILDDDEIWYRKLDIIDSSLSFLYEVAKQDTSYQGFVSLLVERLNKEFSRLNYAYRVVDKQIIEVTSEVEIAEINKALGENNDGVREHLTKAMELCSKRPIGDYRNSIKESISAVEVICRKKTGENDLGRSLSKLQKKGVVIPQSLKSAFEKLYEYTNNEVTGIRHALMDDEGTYTPGADEAIFMIVSCSAFINYLNKK